MVVTVISDLPLWWRPRQWTWSRRASAAARSRCRCPTAGPARSTGTRRCAATQNTRDYAGDVNVNNSTAAVAVFRIYTLRWTTAKVSSNSKQQKSNVHSWELIQSYPDIIRTAIVWNMRYGREKCEQPSSIFPWPALSCLPCYISPVLLYFACLALSRLSCSISPVLLFPLARLYPACPAHPACPALSHLSCCILPVLPALLYYCYCFKLFNLFRQQ